MSSAHPISGHKGRDRWLRAILTRDVLKLLEVRVAVLLGIHFNCTTGQCDPGYDTLASELGISRRTLFRATARLKADGWIAIHRVGGDEHVQFSLFIPPQLVSPHEALPHRGANMLSPQDNGRGDTTLSPQEVSGEVTENGERGDRNGGVEVTNRVAAQRTCEPENLKSAAHAARTSRVDRESDDSTATDGPVPRTALAALKQPLAEQEQPPPCRATSKKMGRPVNADPAERMRWVQFLNVVSAWPQDHVGDEVSAYAVFSRIMGAGRSLHAVIDAVKSTRLDYDDDPPSLTSVLMTIEHNP